MKRKVGKLLCRVLPERKVRKGRPTRREGRGGSRKWGWGKGNPEREDKLLDQVADECSYVKNFVKRDVNKSRKKLK